MLHLNGRKYFSKNFKTGTLIKLPAVQVYSITKNENFTEDSRKLVNPTKIKSILLNDSPLLKYDVRKVLIYNPNKKSQIKEMLIKLHNDYKIDNFIYIGSVEQKYIDEYFESNPFRTEFLMVEKEKFAQIYKTFGYKEFITVLDEQNRITYTTNRSLLKSYFASLFWGCVLIYNFLYLPTVENIISL